MKYLNSSSDAPQEIADPCSRAFWSAAVPAGIALAIALRAVVPAPIVKRVLVVPFAPFLTLAEAEDILYPPTEAPPPPPPPPALGALSVLSCLQAVAWIAVSAVAAAWAPAVIAGTWVFSAARLLLRPKPTPHYDLFVLWTAHLVFAVVEVGIVIYAYAAHGAHQLPPTVELVARVANLCAVTLALGVTLSRSLALPSSHVNSKDIGVTVSPEDYTTFWSWLTFSWVYPIIAKGTHETLNEDDVWDMSPTLRAKSSYIKFQSIIRPSLSRRLLVAHSRDIILHLALTYAAVLLQYSQPMLLNRLLAAIDGTASAPARANAVVYALLMFGASVLKAECELQYLWRCRRLAALIRCELMAAVYDKALRRTIHTNSNATTNTNANANANSGNDKEKEKEKADVGRIVNLMSADVERIALFASMAFLLFSAPVEIAVACVLLYQVLGWSAFAGFSLFALVLPANYLLTKWGVRIQAGLLGASDRRMSVLNELISEIKFIKFFAWGEKWIARALDARRAELAWIKKERIASTFFGLLWMVAPSLVGVASFSVFVWTGHVLTVPIAFTTISLFSLLQNPLNIIPNFVAKFLQVSVSVGRIQSFLEEDEVSHAGSARDTLEGAEDQGETTAIENASFVWNTGDLKAPPQPPAQLKEKSSWLRWRFWRKQPVAQQPEQQEAEQDGAAKPFELRDISIAFPARKLTLVTGATASGKSALLHALLGEMTPSPSSAGGRVVLPAGKVSYAAQAPWLQHRSIRDNILFGAAFDGDRYDTVLDACALKPDLAVLDDGDLTEIGVRRRAVYQHSSLVLLDDPLSAVDSHTARQLLDRLFLGPLLENRTVILVTHHVELMLPAAAFIVRMLDGRVDSAGTLGELRARGVLDAIKRDAEAEAPAAGDPADDANEKMTAETGAKPKQLVEDETRAEGRIKWRVYKTYLRASSYWTWAAIALFIVLFELLKLGELLWIKYWGEASLEASRPPASGLVVQDGPAPTTLPSADAHPMFYVGIYAAITISTATMGILTNVIEYIGAYRASRILFERLLVTVVHAPFRWFDVTPTGRILNRFSRDIEVVDSSLGSSFNTFMAMFATFLVGIFTISFILPAFIIPAVIVAYIYYQLALGYLNTGRDLRRMESVTRSPVFQSFSELLEGVVTVRAFCAEQRFLDALYGMVDLMNKMYWGFWMLNRYLMFRFDVIGAFIVLATALIGLASITSSGGVAGWAGLTITAAMNVTMSVYWTCRFYTQLELDLNSVERLVEYLDLPQEPPAIIESRRPPAYWPSTSGGALLSVENLTIKYAPDLPAVLHGVSFALRARERVGLLGRTGSGKSTIAMSLLRFVEPVSGRIVVDGIDISSIGLQDLRSRINFIPQDAALFSGTIRENLDPFGEYTDEECADALARVHLVSSPASAFASRVPTPTADRAEGAATQVDDARQGISLETKVAAGGSNFSQGQRQLVALARALLRRCSLIVMDEATSSIDFEMDAKIQATIREEFKDSLLLTVAHRLKTVADYDRLIVLDNGNIVEFDTPLNLIRKQGGYFRNMALKSGSFEELEAIAIAAADSKSD